jgi:hypothetical protein
MVYSMRLIKIPCLGILFFVFARQGSFAQCGQMIQQSAFSIAPRGLPTPRNAERDSRDQTVVLNLEMTDRGSVRHVEVLGNPGKLRTAAILAAVRFANRTKHLDRYTWPMLSVVVSFPPNGRGAPRVGQGVVAGVPGCVYVGAAIRVNVSWPKDLPASLKLLLDAKPIMPLLAEQQITIEVVDGWNGTPRTNMTVNVWYGSKIGPPPTQVTTGIDGKAVLNVPGSTEAILIMGQSVADCRANKRRNYIEQNAYQVKDILQAGVVAQNLCGKSQAQSTPGTLLLYVRPVHWWQKMIGQ